MTERVHVTPAERAVIDVSVVSLPASLPVIIAGISAGIIAVIMHTAIIPSGPQRRRGRRG
ncbi:hypothetical protein GCM10009744_11650 [Kribbella alba]|uniref:Uncharacterized protein n=1 Tax=Kribbella alba TaxID=190197 RepID=A0ABN2F0Y0_9ACTN